VVEPTDKGLIVTLNKGTHLSRDEIFQIFGCPGIQVHEAIEVDGELRFSKFRIYEFTRPASYEPLNSVDEAVHKARIEGRADAFDELAREHVVSFSTHTHFANRRDKELRKIESSPAQAEGSPAPASSSSGIGGKAWLVGGLILFAWILFVLLWGAHFAANVGGGS